MTWKGILMANLWLAGHAVVFYGGAYHVVRGDWSKMEKLKCMITDLEPNHLSS